VDKKLYDKLYSKWDKKVYQHVGKPKMPYALAGLKYLKDRTVVDIGSNAGIITYDICEYAKEYIGLEKSEHYYKQSLITQPYIKKPGKFLNLSVSEFLQDTENDYFYDAVYASCVLYHLTQEEIELVETVMLPKCEVVVAVSREDKMKTTSAPSRIKYLYKAKKIDKWLKKNGFSTEKLNEKSNWVTIVGKKK